MNDDDLAAIVQGQDIEGRTTQERSPGCGRRAGKSSWRGQANVNPGGVPTVLAWNDRDSLINLNDDVYRNDPDQVMSYAQVYLLKPDGHSRPAPTRKRRSDHLFPATL